MAIADLVIIAIVVLAGLVSLWLGVVRVVLGLGGWLGAALVTMYGFPYVRPIAMEWIETALFADIAAGGGLFVISLVALTLVTHAIAVRVRESGLGALDRTLGLVTGLCLGAVVVCGGFIVLERVMQWPPERAKRPLWVQTAKSVPVVEIGADLLLSLIPGEWRVSRGPERGISAEEAKDAVRKLMTPATESAAPPSKSGYNPRERREMDRLIQTRQ